MYTSEKIYNEWLNPSWQTGGFVTGSLPRVRQSYQRELLGSTVKGGESCPGFRSKIRLNQSATTDRYVVFHNHKCNPAFNLVAIPAKTPDGNGWKYGYVCYGGYTPCDFGTKLSLPVKPTSAEMSTFESDLAEKFQAKAREMVAPLQGGAFLGELPETIALFASPVRTMFRKIMSYYRKVYRYIKRIKKRKMSREEKHKAVLEYIESAYLMLTFAILPLIGDANTIANALVQYNQKVVRDFNVRLSRLYNHDNSSRLNGAYITTKVTKVRGQVVACLSANATLPPATKERLQEMLAFDSRGLIRDFVPTLWELIPFSFVVDYFSNIGAVVTSKYGDIPQVAWASTTISTIQYRRANIRPPSVSAPSGNWVAVGAPIILQSPGLAEHEAKTIDRSATLPQVSLQLDLELSVKQWINVAALSAIASRVGKLLKNL